MKILLVDDSRLIRMKLKKILSDEYEIVEAEDGNKAFIKVVSEQPDCIVTDLLMPGMDGFEFLEKLRKKKLEYPVVVLTADIQNQTRDRCISLGAVEVLNKPPKEEKLKTAITSAIEGDTKDA